MLARGRPTLAGGFAGSRLAYAEPMSLPAVTRVPAPPVESVHRLPRARVVDRIEFVLGRARGRRVIHLGFVDETRAEERIAHGSWLHAQLARVAGELVGIDVSPHGVEDAIDAGYEAYAADLQRPDEVAALCLEPADVLLAGELIEHLSNPGAMLDAVRPLLHEGGSLIVTTPNAHAFTNLVAELIGFELVNSDHVGWQSWWTGRTLLERHGFRVSEVAYFPFPRLDGAGDLPPAHGGRVRLFNAYLTAVRPLYRVRPSLADGLILVAQRV